MVKILAKDFTISFLYVCIKITDHALSTIFIFHTLIISYSFDNKDARRPQMVSRDRRVMVTEAMKQFCYFVDLLYKNVAVSAICDKNQIICNYYGVLYNRFYLGKSMNL